MSLVHSFTVGRLRCHTLEGGLQHLDGGAMFGVVPKPLWERMIRPDERNRIPLAMRCLLVEHPDGLVLIDTALGNKENQKFQDIYGIRNRGQADTCRSTDLPGLDRKGMTFDAIPQPLRKGTSLLPVGVKRVEGGTLVYRVRIL